MQTQSAASGILKPVAVLTIGLLSSCVSQTRYDEAEMAAKKLEQRYFEVDRERAALETENLRLKRQLEASQVGVENASFSDIDERLATLGQTVAELGKKPGETSPSSRRPTATATTSRTRSCSRWRRRTSARRGARC